MDGVKSLKSIIETKIGVPLVFKLLTTVLICAVLNPLALAGEEAMYLIFIYPLDLIFSVLILIFNQREKPLNIITLLCVILTPLLAMGPMVISIVWYSFSGIAFPYCAPSFDEIGFWGGLFTIVLISFDAIRFNKNNG